MICFLIDDDPEDREIFEMALADVPATVRCIAANDGIAALNMLHHDQAFVPDFIFLDLNMPRMGGKQCLVELKKIERLQNIPVFIFTTSNMAADRAETQALGAADFFTKPSTVGELTNLLTGVFRRN